MIAKFKIAHFSHRLTRCSRPAIGLGLALILACGSLASAPGLALAMPSQQTTGSAALVKDIRAGAPTSAIYHLANLNGTLFFGADDGANGMELWKSNGTAAGTVLVKDIWPGAGQSAPGQDFLAVWRMLVFAADDGTHGRELWKTDGTTAGTALVKDIRPGGNGSAPFGFTHAGDWIFFVADDGAHGYELWIWRFAEYGAEPVLVKDINPGANSSFPSQLAFVNGGLIFVANNGANGYELWKSDGTTAGTSLVKDIRPGAVDAAVAGLTSVNGTLFFAANNGTSGAELWKSDGTNAGTVLVSDIWQGATGGVPNSSSPAFLTALGGTLFFAAVDGTSGAELWKSDGTDAGTALVADIWPGVTDGIPHNSQPTYLTAGWGLVYFAATNPIVGRELWKSDGTAAGTVWVKNIYPGEWSPGAPKSSDPTNLMHADGHVFFVADDGAYGRELWKSDGTNPGTAMVNDIWSGSVGPGAPNSSLPSHLTYGNAALYFLAEEEDHGRELWVLPFGDADGDGLLDEWETYGIDYNRNGTSDLNLPALGANPAQKDLFVEIDYMVGVGADSHLPLLNAGQYQALEDVSARFAAHGITLHYTVDENAGHVAAPSFDSRGPGANDDFDDLKAARFGTAADRASANAANILGARQQAFRYVIYGHDFAEAPGTSGAAEIGGNDMMVTLGSATAADIALHGGQRVVESGTFMHEFGHTLALLHGGGDPINCKPNYLSVMSYALQTQLFTARPLDYSDQALASLNENGGLSEPAGIGGPAGRDGVFGVGGASRTAPANGAFNWNDDLDSTDLGVTADVNHIAAAGCGPSPNETLAGFNDWANLVFNFRMSADFAAGARTTSSQTHEPELAPSAEVSGDVSVNMVDSPDPALVGQSVSYTLTVHNAGPDVVTAVTLVDALPASATLVSASPGCVASPSLITCSVGSLAAGATTLVSITIIPSSPGTIVNTANVAAAEPDPDSSNNSAIQGTLVVGYRVWLPFIRR